jgi:hypothetical protein
MAMEIVVTRRDAVVAIGFNRPQTSCIAPA